MVAQKYEISSEKSNIHTIKSKFLVQISKIVKWYLHTERRFDFYTFKITNFCTCKNTIFLRGRKLHATHYEAQIFHFHPNDFTFERFSSKKIISSESKESFFHHRFWQHRTADGRRSNVSHHLCYNRDSTSGDVVNDIGRQSEAHHQNMCNIFWKKNSQERSTTKYRAKVTDSSICFNCSLCLCDVCSLSENWKLGLLSRVIRLVCDIDNYWFRGLYTPSQWDNKSSL